MRNPVRSETDAIAWCEREGFDVTGKVGDPMTAFAADEVLISTYPRGHSNWLETGIIERLRDELEIPVTHIVAEGAQASPTGAP